MSVRIRMKQLGRKHRPYYRICAMDIRCPRDGRVLEELGTYDPMIADTDARAVLNGERIDHWLSVGAQPSDKVSVLIKKYGTNGTHLAAQQTALDRLALSRRRPEPPASMPRPAKPAPKAEAEEASEQPAAAPEPVAAPEPQVEQPVAEPVAEEPKAEVAETTETKEE